MTHLVLLTSMVAFVVYFFMIGFPRLSTIPAAIIIVFSVNSMVNYKLNLNVKQIIEQNSLYISTVLILLGISGLFLFLGVEPLYTAIYMICINLVMWIGSYITNYIDGKKLFHIMYYLSYIVFVIVVSTLTDAGTLLMVVGYTIPLQLVIYSFLTFIIGYFFDVGNIIKGLTYAYAHLTLLWGMFFIFRDVTLPYLLAAQLYLTATYYITHYFLGITHKKVEIKPISAKEILKGKKIIDHQNMINTRKNESARSKGTQHFLQNLDPRVRLLINSYNSILILIIIAFYVIVFRDQIPILQDQALYRTSVVLFFINFILIQENDTLPKRQRIFVFIIINFAIYSNIIYIGGDQVVTIAMLGIIWNIANSLLILYSKSIMPRGLIKDHDYRYWIVANILGIPVNIFFLSKISVTGSLMFALISTYLGLQGFLLYYNVKYIKKEINTDM